MKNEQITSSINYLCYSRDDGADHDQHQREGKVIASHLQDHGRELGSDAGERHDAENDTYAGGGGDE